MGAEEQQEEREVLESIFPDEITYTSPTEFRISIKLEVTNEPDDETEPPTLYLNVTYPEDYPDEPPRLDITNPPNAPKHVYLDVQDDKETLLSALNETITENLGMAMIFTLVTVLKDSAELLISDRQAAKEAVMAIEKRKIEEEEDRKFHGEQVTRESFLAWRERFQKEMKEEAERKEAEREVEEKKKRGPKEEKKMTGRELWTKGLAREVEGEEGVEEGLERIRIQEAAA